ncbi:putative transcriptional regulator YqhC [Desulfovibrio sp. DV]|nr:putative transcriptional regulator YqhC [Desulfovibrio sp. DV]
MAEELKNIMASLAVRECESPSALPRVTFSRHSRSQPRAPAIYQPGVVILGQGRKRGYFGPEVYEYDADNYLVLAVPLPAECEVIASPQEPMISMRLDVDAAMVADLLLAMGDNEPGMFPWPKGAIAPTPLTSDVREAATRLVRALSSPMDSRVLAPALARELLYRVLLGAQGGLLRALAVRHGDFARIADLLHRIHANYAMPLEIDDLASQAGMSPATLHRHFKAVTATSPMQYVKAIRLHKARMLMIADGIGVAMAASRVGYESPSQFSREYKRFFKTSPAADAAGWRASNTPIP